MDEEETCLPEDTLRTRGQLFSDYLGGIGVRTNMGFGPKTGTWGQEQDMSRTCPGQVLLSLFLCIFMFADGRHAAGGCNKTWMRAATATGKAGVDVAR